MLNRNFFNELLAIAEQIEPYYIEMEVKQTLIPFIYIYLFYDSLIAFRDSQTNL